MMPKTKIDKIKCFTEVKELGQRWITGGKKERDELVQDLVAMQRPKGTIYPAMIHRYIVKELGFPEGSKFVTHIMEYTCQ